MTNKELIESARVCQNGTLCKDCHMDNEPFDMCRYKLIRLLADALEDAEKDKATLAGYACEVCEICANRDKHYRYCALWEGTEDCRGCPYEGTCGEECPMPTELMCDEDNVLCKDCPCRGCAKGSKWARRDA